MDYSNYDNNLLIRELQQEIKELTETIARLRKISAAAYAKIDKLEETKTNCNITKAFQADALDNMDYGQF